MRFALENETKVSGVKFYCEYCREHSLAKIEPLQADKLNRSAIWGDIVCTECHFVVATVSTDEPGIYAFVKVGEIPSQRNESET